MCAFEEKNNSEEISHANERFVEGFNLSTNPEQLNKNYELLFDGIDSATLEEFKRIFEQVPDEVKSEMQKGNMEPLTSYATTVLKWSKRKAAQLVVGFLVTLAAAPAFASSKNVAAMIIPDGGIGAMMEIPKEGLGGQMTIKAKSGADQMEEDILSYKQLRKTNNSDDMVADDVDEKDNMQITGKIVMNQRS